MKLQFTPSRLFVGYALCLPLINQTATADANKTASAVSSPQKTPYYRNWRLVAGADLIVQGKLRVPVLALKAATKAKRDEYIALQLDVAHVLKGPSGEKTLNIQFYTASGSYGIPVNKVVSLNGKEVTAFITASDGRYLPGGLYFAGYTPDTLASSSRWLTQHVADEVSNQKRIQSYFARPSGFKNTLLDAKVKKLIEGMSNKKTQSRSFAELEALGKGAVPATIRWMNNRRPLAVPYISLRNDSPQAFEAVRQYGPKLTVDALAAILNQVTGESFGFIYNGASETERQREVNGWRTYLYYGRPANGS